MTEPLRYVRDAVKRLGGVAALTGASLDPSAGEVHAPLGENGAGRSTLLRSAAGVHNLEHAHRVDRLLALPPGRRSLLGYLEADDLDAARSAMPELDVNTRWQQRMSEYFTDLDGRRPDEGFQLLDERVPPRGPARRTPGGTT